MAGEVPAGVGFLGVAELLSAGITMCFSYELVRQAEIRYSLPAKKVVDFKKLLRIESPQR